MKPLIALLLPLLLISASGASATSPADALADRMLEALGGRAAWARVKNTVNDSQQNRAGEPPVVRAVITMDFERERFRIDTTGPELALTRVVDGERHWRRSRAGVIEPYSTELLADDRRFYAGHVYRTLQRIAARDPAIELRVGSDGRLEVHAKGGARIAWYLLDARGEPYRYGAHDDDAGTLFGPWEHVQDGIRHPVWVSSRDGTWRATLKSLKVNVALEQALFERPSR